MGMENVIIQSYFVSYYIIHSNIGNCNICIGYVNCSVVVYMEPGKRRFQKLRVCVYLVLSNGDRKGLRI